MEEWAPLPARPRGFLRTVRELRLAAAVAPPGTESLSVRLAYEQALGRLPPTDALNGARQWGDGVALRLRLGDLAAAEAVARDGMRLFPGDHRLAALLGAVCHSREDWAQAERALSVAFALAASQPERLLDRDHLAWVRSRARGSGVWLGELAGRWKGKEGLAGAQALCLRVPTDPLLPVLVAARCRALGDAHAALALVESVVGESGVRHEWIVSIRNSLVKEVAAAKGHIKDLYISDSPLLPRDTAVQLPVVKDGVQPLPWALLGKSRRGTGRKAVVHDVVLESLEGKTISITGCPHFLGDEAPAGPVALVELPFGCWHCDMPGLGGMLELFFAEGQNPQPTRELIHLKGVLRLNQDNPEGYFFYLEEALILP